MAGKTKEGLDYYPHDTNAFSDRKIKRLIKNLHGNGYLVYDYVRSLIYGDKGYYIKWDSELVFDVADDLKVTEPFVIETITFCCQIGLFNQDLLDREKILTSHGIQKRYLKICKAAKRSNYDIHKTWVLNEEKDMSTEEMIESPEEMPIYPEEMPINPEEIPQRKKVKESKVKKTTTSYAPPPDQIIDGYLPLSELKQVVLADEKFIYQFHQIGLPRPGLDDWLDAFHRRLEYENTHMKPEKDYRWHFGNWIVQRPYRTQKPEDYSPIREPPPKKPNSPLPGKPIINA